MTTTVTIATVDTSHFSFLALGRDAEHAKMILMSAWRKHAEQYGADPDHVRYDDIDVVTAFVGQSFVDGEPFPNFDVTTWADGFGRWHASITAPNIGNIPAEMIFVARDAIADEIIAREQSPSRSADQIREAVHVELVEKGRRDADRHVRFHYAEAEAEIADAPTRETPRFDMDRIVQILRDDHGIANAYVEQTGGGCATIFAGPTRVESDYGTRYAVVAGPGTYGWQAKPSTAVLGDFYVGPDDDGESMDDVTTVTEGDEADIARIIAGQVNTYIAKNL